MHEWTPPGDWLRITTIDAHAAGEPLRIVSSGFPDPPGSTILEKRRHAQEQLDHLRTLLMWEPRGHADMYGCVFTEPVTPDGDVGVLFLHNEGFSTMCGHGIIALVVVAAATGMLTEAIARGEVRIDTPAGRVTAVPHLTASDRVDRVTFRNVPSFVPVTNLAVDVDEFGEVICDVAYGGAFYAYVPAERLGFRLVPEETQAIIDAGRRISEAVRGSLDIAHPSGDPDLGFLYGTIFVGAPHLAGSHSRNVCVFADGEVDRSPTGTGVSGRLAIHHARGDVAAGERIVVESILGTTFTGEIVGETMVGSHPAVIPEIGGRAWITGKHQFLVDPSDPLAAGFLLR